MHIVVKKLAEKLHGVSSAWAEWQELYTLYAPVYARNDTRASSTYQKDSFLFNVIRLSFFEKFRKCIHIYWLQDLIPCISLFI